MVIRKNMKQKIGKTFMLLGLLMLIGGAALLIYNHSQAMAAEHASALLLPQIAEEIRKSSTEEQNDFQNDPVASIYTDVTMTEVEIDGHLYIGYLSIPVLELELPVMSGWDYPSLQIAPCRYSGTVKGKDLVLMAHNYDKHFGNIDQLESGDTVLFTDMDGVITEYEVAAVDVLAPSAVEEMTSGVFDLTLFTCTYGGQNRVTVYCDRFYSR